MCHNDVCLLCVCVDLCVCEREMCVCVVCMSVCRDLCVCVCARVCEYGVYESVCVCITRV